MIKATDITLSYISSSALILRDILTHFPLYRVHTRSLSRSTRCIRHDIAPGSPLHCRFQTCHYDTFEASRTSYSNKYLRDKHRRNHLEQRDYMLNSFTGESSLARNRQRVRTPGVCEESTSQQIYSATIIATMISHCELLTSATDSLAVSRVSLRAADTSILFSDYRLTIDIRSHAH